MFFNLLLKPDLTKDEKNGPIHDSRNNIKNNNNKHL